VYLYLHGSSEITTPHLARFTKHLTLTPRACAAPTYRSESLSRCHYVRILSLLLCYAVPSGTAIFMKGTSFAPRSNQAIRRLPAHQERLLVPRPNPPVRWSTPPTQVQWRGMYSENLEDMRHISIFDKAVLKNNASFEKQWTPLPGRGKGGCSLYSIIGKRLRSG